MTGQPVGFVTALIGQLAISLCSTISHRSGGISRHPCLVDSILEYRRLSARSLNHIAISMPLHRASRSFLPFLL
jgi:hypothetical protein